MKGCGNNKVIKQYIVPKKECVIMCDCGGDDFAQFIIFEKDDDEDYDEMDTLYFSVGGCKMYRWRDRIKSSWQIIRRGEFRNHGVIIGRDKVKKLRRYFKDILDYWDQNYK